MINIIADEVFLILGVCFACYVVFKIKNHGRRHMPRRPDVGEVYLSSFADDNTVNDKDKN